MDYAKVALETFTMEGKNRNCTNLSCRNKDDLSIAYTPGVAAPCIQIHKDVNDAYEYCRKWNLVAAVTDGTAVLDWVILVPRPVCLLWKASQFCLKLLVMWMRSRFVWLQRCRRNCTSSENDCSYLWGY